MTNKPRIKNLPEGSAEHCRALAVRVVDSIEFTFHEFRSHGAHCGTAEYEKALAKLHKACAALIAMSPEDLASASDEAMREMLQPDKGEGDD